MMLVRLERERQPFDPASCYLENCLVLIAEKVYMSDPNKVQSFTEYTELQMMYGRSDCTFEKLAE